MNNHYDEIGKANRLIVEFMGATIVPNQGEAQIDHFILSGETYVIWDLKYHKDWNWLIPVMVKIKHLSINEIPLLPRNGFEKSVAPFIDKQSAIRRALLNYDLTESFNATNAFIEWYNENKGFIGAA